MTHPIYASGFLETARKLAGAAASAGRPALADLRRATSTAYYALFHHLIRHGAIDFLSGAGEDEIAEIARWFTHTGVLKASQLVVTAAGSRRLDQISRDDKSAVMALRAASGKAYDFSDDLVQVADAFSTLQSARHDADYDGNYDPTRPVTLAHIDRAEEGVRAASRLWNDTRSDQKQHAHNAYCCFLELAMMKSGGPKAR